MLCLGISEDFFDAGVTLCNGPKVVFASNEERYTRRKNEGGFPFASLAALLEYTQVPLQDIERIVVAGHMTPPLPIRMFRPLHRLRFNAHRSKNVTLFRRITDFVTHVTPMSHTSEDSLMRRL
ncbi:MAG TPA: hypothetical protein ENN80_01980, partial [Candidatus Hydrogenedentes bacterium]|nr:hypothetical protein [Candidatus Hydrogenedentota bacterium]